MMRLIESEGQARSWRLRASTTWTLGWRTSMAPYLYVRLLLHHTVGIAASRPPRDKKERSADLSKILQNLRAARRAVHTCLEVVKHRGFPTGESGLPWEERTGRKSKVLDDAAIDSSALSAMDFIIEGIEADLARLDVSATTVTPFSGSERERRFKTKFILNTKG